MLRPDPLAERPWKGLSFLVLDAAGIEIGPRGVVRIPYRLRDGPLFRSRYYAPGGRAWWGPGVGLLPFGLETLHEAPLTTRRALAICEGEADTLAFREAFAGVTSASPVRGYDAIGVPGAHTWRPDWALLAQDYALIYVLGDGDDAGRALNAAVLRDLPWARPVRLPDGQDVRSILQGRGARALDAHLEEADALALLALGWKTCRTYEALVAFLRGGAEGVAARG